MRNLWTSPVDLIPFKIRHKIVQDSQGHVGEEIGVPFLSIVKKRR